MQRGVTPGGSSQSGSRSCAHCGGALVRSHREYAGGGASVDVLRCGGCGRTVTTGPRQDSQRLRPTGRSRRHQPVDEGPPPNPVLDADVARRLRRDLAGDTDG
ncbi:MAG: hypothetical protein M3R48_05255 [Candidatus Dormibacteraeota bacterium]|nr:hypothetical protein [Candidatus Dormibacteraeota bacterium]